MSRVLPYRRGDTDICGLPEGAEIAVQLEAIGCWCVLAVAASRCLAACRRFPGILLTTGKAKLRFTLPQVR